ncbi:MgtC/SapB family protein [Acidovorax temperans]|uniref:MgtC/SapB family protein n=1 Tax=Acidovorax temperans TaxID=80878 RepID=UPI0028967C08|nr:DUF4010 domain-containing protein [Acidovorax temperans]
MQDLQGFYAALAVLASALGCGLLMGIERERRKGSGPHRALAGVRSFTLASLSGAAAALSGSVALLGAGAAFVAALGVVAYARDRSENPGVATEIALLLAYLIGVLCASDRLLAAALAVMVTGLLALRAPLHEFSSHWLQPGEVRSGLVLAALVLLVFPLVPNQPLMQGLLNPQVVFRLVIVLLVIQSLAHVARRLMQARQAVVLSALASGFVSSTATIASLGMDVRAGKAPARTQAAGAVLSCVATALHVLVVAATVQPHWLPYLALPALAGAGVAAVWGLWLLWGAADQSTAKAPLQADAPMFKLRDVVLITLLLTGIQVGVAWLERTQGNAGMMAGALLAALADVHAAAAAVLMHALPTEPEAVGVERALMAALLVHAVSKSVVAWVSGGGAYALAVAPGVLAHTLAFVGVLVLL